MNSDGEATISDGGAMNSGNSGAMNSDEQTATATAIQ